MAKYFLKMKRTSKGGRIHFALFNWKGQTSAPLFWGNCYEVGSEGYPNAALWEEAPYLNSRAYGYLISAQYSGESETPEYVTGLDDLSPDDAIRIVRLFGCGQIERAITKFLRLMQYPSMNLAERSLRQDQFWSNRKGRLLRIKRNKAQIRKKKRDWESKSALDRLVFLRRCYL